MASNSNRKYWLGFDLGGTKMMATVFDSRFKIKGFHRTKTKGHEGAKEVMARMLETIREALDESHVKASQLGGIGVGCPGPLDLDKGIILHAPNLGWKNVRLKDTLEKLYHCPTVIANDVDAGTFGEYRFGAAQGAHCALGVFPGTGIGGACVYEGHLLRGRVGSCMEIGHVKIQAEGRHCGCGQRGCLETIASRLAISADVAAAAYRGEAPHLLKLAGTDLRQIKSGVLAEAIEEGDEVIETIVRNAARQLGTAISGVINLLAPDIVVLGGGLVEAMPKLYLEEIRSAVQEFAMKAFLKDVKIVTARLGDNAGVMGAAALAAEAATK
jgi:glucokinase